MTDLELKNEIENGPLANIFLEFWNTGNDVAIAKIFNNPNLTDAHARKRGEQTGLDTLVVHALNDVN